MFNDNLVNLIKNKFQDCIKAGVSFRPAYYPHIVKKQEEKALKHFIEIENEGETVLMLFDTSLFSKGKNGLALTDQAVYFKDMMGPTYKCKYKHWRIDADDAAELLHISDGNTFLLPAFLTGLLNEICTLKKYEGLFEAEEQEADAKAELQVEQKGELKEEPKNEQKAENVAAESAEETGKTMAAEDTEEGSDKEDGAEKKVTDKEDGAEKRTEVKKDGAVEDDEDDDDEEDDDEGGTFLDILGVVLDVTSDPSIE